jgi:hypothetical protein
MDKYIESIINFRITPKVVMWAAFCILFVSVGAALLCKFYPASDGIVIDNPEGKIIFGKPIRPQEEEIIPYPKKDYQILILDGWGYCIPKRHFI